MPLLPALRSKPTHASLVASEVALRRLLHFTRPWLSCSFSSSARLSLFNSLYRTRRSRSLSDSQDTRLRPLLVAAYAHPSSIPYPLPPLHSTFPCTARRNSSLFFLPDSRTPSPLPVFACNFLYTESTPSLGSIRHKQQPLSFRPLFRTSRRRYKMGSGSNTFTVDDALISQGFGYFQVLVLAYAGMGWISEATEMMLLSFVGPSVQVQWNLSSHEESLITSVVFVGMLIGAYSWGIVSDNYGRRVGFLFTAIVTSAAGLFSSFAPNYISLLILRFVVGIGLGGGPVLASWFLEFVPAPNRGTWMVIFQGFWTIGTILEASLAWAVMPKLGWRWLLVFSSIPSFLLLLFYRMVPESPRYLCMKGRTSEARHILEKMARTNRMTLPPGVLVSDRRTELDENPHSSESTHLINVQNKKTAVVDEVKPETGGITAFSNLLSPELIRSTLLLWITFFGNAFSYYGIVLLTSELSGGSSKCLSEPILRNSVGSSLYKDVFISSFAEVPGLLLSATTVDRFGRKLSMSAMLFISCAFLLPLVFEQNEAITTALLFGARVCISGSFTVVYVYAPEIYPTSLRTTGVGTASSVGRIGGMLCPLVAVALVHGCHRTIALLLFELVLFLSGMAVIFFPLETSGKGLPDSVSSMK